MRITQEGIDLIKRWEGLKLKAYLCPANVWTIGYGHTTNVTPGMEITEEQAEELLRKDLEVFEAVILNNVVVELTEHQFAALVSWAYNVGAGAVRRSTLLKKLNAGDYDSVPAQLARWNRVNGRVVQGLTNRRAAEAGLWARGSFVSSREIEPGAPAEQSPVFDASILGTAAAAAATAAPAITSLGGVPWPVGVALIVAIVSVFALFILKRRAQ
jgi:lysozyme